MCANIAHNAQLFLQVMEGCQVKGKSQAAGQGCNDGILLGKKLVDCRNKVAVDVLICKVRSGAFVVAIKFVIALPDGLFVLIIGVPGFGAVPASALATADFAGEKVDTASSAALAAPFHFLLHHLEYFWADDCLMVTFHIVLRYLALVDLFLLGEEIHRVALLQKRIAFVFLIGEDAANSSRIPFILAARRFNAVSGEPGGNAVRRHALQEHTVNAADDDRLVLIQDEIAIGTPVVAKKSLEGYGDLAVCEPLSLSPGAVLGNAAAFFLRQRGHNGDKQFSLAVQRPDVFLFKIDLHALLQTQEAALIEEVQMLADAVEKCIYENAHVALDQTEYQKRYDGLVHRYDEAKAQLDAITEQIADKKARRATSEEFLKVLERQDGLVTEFQTNLWCGLVDFVTVYARNDVKITFKNGSEIFVKDFE